MGPVDNVWKHFISCLDVVQCSNIQNGALYGTKSREDVRCFGVWGEVGPQWEMSMGMCLCIGAVLLQRCSKYSPVVCPMPAKHIRISQPNCLSCQELGSELLPIIEQPKTSHKPTEGMGMVADNNDDDIHRVGQQIQIKDASFWLWKKREMKRKPKVDSHAKGWPVVLLALLLLFIYSFDEKEEKSIIRSSWKVE